MTTPKSTHQLLVEVIQWATEAALEHVELARYNNEDPDPQTGMGLWQAFQAKFPKEGVPYEARELLVTCYGEVYSSTVKSLVAYRPDGGRAEFEASRSTLTRVREANDLRDSGR